MTMKATSMPVRFLVDQRWIAFEIFPPIVPQAQSRARLPAKRCPGRRAGPTMGTAPSPARKR